jgi:hypothetical protein
MELEEKIITECKGAECKNLECDGIFCPVSTRINIYNIAEKVDSMITDISLRTQQRNIRHGFSVPKYVNIDKIKRDLRFQYDRFEHMTEVFFPGTVDPALRVGKRYITKVSI